MSAHYYKDSQRLQNAAKTTRNTDYIRIARNFGLKYPRAYADPALKEATETRTKLSKRKRGKLERNKRDPEYKMDMHAIFRNAREKNHFPTDWFHRDAQSLREKYKGNPKALQQIKAAFHQKQPLDQNKINQLIWKHNVDQLALRGSINAFDKTGKPPLGFALGPGGPVDYLEKVLKLGARTNGTLYHQGSKYKIGEFAAMYGSPEKMQMLFRYGLKSPLGSLLQYAIFARNNDIARMLLDRGANVNFADDESGGMTPLHLAVLRGNLDGARLLLQRGADASKLDHSKESPLDVALKSKTRDMVELLSEYIRKKARTSRHKASVRKSGVRFKIRSVRRRI